MVRKRGNVIGQSIDLIPIFGNQLLSKPAFPSPSGRRWSGGLDEGGRLALAAPRLGRPRSARRREPVGPAPFEPMERAFARSPQRRDVVGQKHEPERQHPEAEDRQDGEAAADDQQYAGRDARPARGGLSEPAGCGLHAPGQPAEEPPQPPLMVRPDDIVGKGQVLRPQAPDIGARAGSRNPYDSLFRPSEPSVRPARSSWPPRRGRRRSPGSARGWRRGRAGAAEASPAD